MKKYGTLLFCILIAFIPLGVIAATDTQNWDNVQSDERITFSIPAQDWIWEELEIDQGLEYLISSKEVGKTDEPDRVQLTLKLVPNPRYALLDKEDMQTLFQEFVGKNPDYSIKDVKPEFSEDDKKPAYITAKWVDKKNGGWTTMMIISSKKNLAYVTGKVLGKSEAVLYGKEIEGIIDSIQLN